MRSTFFFAATVSLLAAIAHAQPKGEAFFEGEPKQFQLTGSGASKATAKPIKIAGQPFEKGWRVEVREKVGDYHAQLAAPLPAGLKKGDVILLTAWARLIDTADESGEGRVGFVLEQAKDPYDKVFNAPFSVKKEWTRFDVPAEVKLDFASTGGQFTIRLGEVVQTIEIGGFEVRKFPAGTKVSDLPRTKVSYVGRDADAKWRQPAAERIERLRKAPLTIKVVDASGQPVSGATVEMKMTRHAFVFGSCYSPDRILGTTPEDEKYRAIFREYFNTGVDEYAMKWPGWVDPAVRQKALDALKWMDEHDVKVRGHVMVWPGTKRVPQVVKDAIEKKDGEKLKQLIAAHIAKVGADLKGRVIDWDVVNEPFVNHAIQDILGNEAMAEWFKLARKADPTAVLYLNETSVPTAPPADIRYTTLFEQAKMIQRLGGDLGGVGMQAHFAQNVQPPQNLLGIFDRFATLGVPTRITELDIDTNDESLQADYLRDFLTTCFSHENINGVMIWGFWEPAHWRPQAAMFRKDWSPRPIAAVWKDLIFKQWWTTERGTTGADGTLAVRGFLGSYDITVTANGKTQTAKVQLHQGGTTATVTLK